MKNYKLLYIIIFFIFYSCIFQNHKKIKTFETNFLIDSIKKESFYSSIKDSQMLRILKKYQEEHLPFEKEAKTTINGKEYILKQRNGFIRVCKLNKNTFNIYTIGLITEFYGCSFEYISIIDNDMVIVSSENNQWTIKDSVSKNSLNKLVYEYLKNDVYIRLDIKTGQKFGGSVIFRHPSYWEVILDKEKYIINKKDFDLDFDKSCYCRKIVALTDSFNKK